MMKLFLPAIAAGLGTVSAARAEEVLPVFGNWDCGEVMGFALDARNYNVNGQNGSVDSIEMIAADAFGVTLDDGYRFALFDVTPGSLTWHSPESGDTFDCRRQQ